MPPAKFTSDQRIEMMLRVEEMYLSGQTQAEISKVIGVTQQQISLYLQRLQMIWTKRLAERVDERISRELARLDRLELENWRAWRRSCENEQTTVNRAKTTSVKEETEQGIIDVPALDREWTHTERGQSGDPRFLQGVRDCIEMRLRIVGGFAPTKIEVNAWRKDMAAAGLNPDALVADLFSKVPQVAETTVPVAEDADQDSTDHA